MFHRAVDLRNAWGRSWSIIPGGESEPSCRTPIPSPHCISAALLTHTPSFSGQAGWGARGHIYQLPADLVPSKYRDNFWFYDFFFSLFITPGEQLMSGKITNLEKWQKLKTKKSHGSLTWLTIRISLRLWKLHWLLFTWLYRTLSFVSF